MDFIIENEDGFSFEKVVKLYPTKHYYKLSGKKLHIKYSCPVCEMCGFKHQVHPCDTRCPNCGVNLLWEAQNNEEEQK